MEKKTKTSIIDSIYAESDYNLNDVHKIVDLFLQEIEKNLSEGNSVELRGFGVFNVSLRKGRDNAIIPSTGEKIKIPDSYIVKFHPGKQLKDTVKKIPIPKIS